MSNVHPERLQKAIDHAEKANAFYVKIMEMIATFSAGTIGVIVALGSTNKGNNGLIFWAVLLLIITIVSVFIFLTGQAKMNLAIARRLVTIAPSQGLTTIPEPLWTKFGKIIALSCYGTANLMLLATIT